MEKILEEIKDVKYKVELAKNGQDHTLKLEKGTKSKYVLSKYNPQGSIASNFKIKNETKETVWIIFGFGFGYLIKGVFEKCGEDATVIVIEPSHSLLEEEIRKSDHTYFKDKENLIFFSGERFEDFTSLMKKRINLENVDNINVIEHPGYVEFYINYYKKIIQIIAEVRAGNLVNSNTFKAIGGMHIKNIIKNMRSSEQMCDLRMHKDKYKGIPAVIVSAGPSLSNNIQHIKGFNGLIFAAGRTLSMVKEQGKEVDFTALIDWSDKIQATFQGEEKDTPLIALNSGNHKLIENASGSLYLVERGDLTNRIFNIKLESLDMGGSVATLCLSAAHYMGCNPIIFIGQDLAYTGMKGYAKECNIFEKNIQEEYERNQHNYRKIKGYYGEEVVSDYALIGFLRWIEGFIGVYNDRTYINATEGGADIEGTIKMSFQEVIKKYDQLKKPIIEHNRIKAQGINLQKHLQDCFSTIEKSMQLIKLAKQLSNTLKKEYSRYKGERIEKVRLCMSKLDEIDEELSTLEAMALFEYVFQANCSDIVRDKSYQEALGETDLQNAIRLAEKNYKLYEGLYNAAQEVAEIVDEAIKSGAYNIII